MKTRKIIIKFIIFIIIGEISNPPSFIRKFKKKIEKDKYITKAESKINPIPISLYFIKGIPHCKSYCLS